MIQMNCALVLSTKFCQKCLTVFEIIYVFLNLWFYYTTAMNGKKTVRDENVIHGENNVPCQGPKSSQNKECQV